MAKFLPADPMLAFVNDIVALLPFLAAIVVIGLILLFAWRASKQAKKRQESLQSMATELGLRYQMTLPGEFDGRISKYELTQTGRDRRSYNFIVASTDELTLSIFDQQYTTGSGKHKHVIRQTVAWIIGKRLNVPPCTLAPESWMSRLADFFLRKDIDFPEDAEFSKAFVLSGKDPEPIRQYFDLQRRQALMKIKLPTIEFFPGELMFFRPGQIVQPAKLKELMDEAFQIYQAFSDRDNGQSNQEHAVT